ncbi:isocitrate lyase/PEP mutase family protein [Pedobacter steynii]|uniref:2-Methylisocitrate lyase, PEP mutase family n=1 Tax=Pedobacter steynii TaxID=430522 RepID=A0A1D7QIF8_9SPHI|nr:isocitrate lyase/phosphoenolpyruvate mutase family protein [Pedobacter steynii]AOM78451.1 hypothetical protein BFS30_15465 [Pedobacter steynii]
MGTFKKFVELHQNTTPFLLGNIWDVKSAQVFEASGYQAIGTSSQALANSFGYEDGEKLPFEIILQLAKRVVELVQIPFSVDLEGGHSRTVSGIIEHIEKLHDVGVAGINLEDTIAGSTRTLQSVANFQQLLLAISNHIERNNLKIFLNIRTDGFLLGMPAALQETLSRINAYQNSGADGIFVPCITKKDDIIEVVKSTSLPINVMCMPGLPDFKQLEMLGVKRISMGGFFFNRLYEDALKRSAAIVNERDFSAIFS